MIHLWIISFLFGGTISDDLIALVICWAASAALILVYSRSRRSQFVRAIKKAVAYCLMLIVCHRLDVLLFNKITGWPDSARTLASISLIAQELRLFSSVFKKKIGFDVPVLSEKTIKKLHDLTISNELRTILESQEKK